MPEKCSESCPVLPRVEALEEANRQHGKSHAAIYDRLRELEKSDAVQDAHYKNIDAKLDELTVLVRELTAKPGRRWDALVEKALWAFAAAVIAFLLARMGL